MSATRFPAPVEDTDRDVAQDRGNGGGGGRYDRMDKRIGALELDVREIKTRTENAATTNDIDLAVSGLKNWAMENVATKRDIDLAVARWKAWVMGGSLVGALAVIGWLVYALIRAWG